MEAEASFKEACREEEEEEEDGRRGAARSGAKQWRGGDWRARTGQESRRVLFCFAIRDSGLSAACCVRSRALPAQIWPVVTSLSLVVVALRIRVRCSE